MSVLVTRMVRCLAPRVTHRLETVIAVSTRVFPDLGVINVHQASTVTEKGELTSAAMMCKCLRFHLSERAVFAYEDAWMIL